MNSDHQHPHQPEPDVFDAMFLGAALVSVPMLGLGAFIGWLVNR